MVPWNSVTKILLTATGPEFHSVICFLLFVVPEGQCCTEIKLVENGVGSQMVLQNVFSTLPVVFVIGRAPMNKPIPVQQ